MENELLTKLQAQQQQKERKEAEDKQDYKKMIAKVEHLERTVERLETTIDKLQSTLETINVKQYERESSSVFTMLRHEADQITEALNLAELRAKSIGEKSWKEYAAEGIAVAMFFIALNLLVLWFIGLPQMKQDIDYNRQHIDVIQWKQTTGTVEGARKYSPWETQDFIKAWNNENRYQQELKQKQQENAAQK